MQQLPVDKCIDILNVYCAHSNGELWVNEIVRKVMEITGSKDTPRIKSAINLLKKGRILEGRKIGRQKEIQLPTPLGCEIIQYMDDIRSVKEAFNKFYPKFNQYHMTLGKSRDMIAHMQLKKGREMINRILSSKGWKKPDIDSFYALYVTLTVFFKIFIFNISNLLLTRFIRFIEHSMSNSISNEIVTNILFKEMIYLSSVFAKSNISHVSIADDKDIDANDHITYISDPFKSTMTDPFFNHLDKAFGYNLFPNDASILSEGNELIKALIGMVGLNSIQLKRRADFISLPMDKGLMESIGKRYYPNSHARLAKIYYELANNNS